MKILPIIAICFAASGCTREWLYEDTLVTEQKPVIIEFEEGHASLFEARECYGETLPGLNGSATSNNYSYKLGCSMNRAMLAQIANPEHALGRGGLGGSQMSGDRASNIVRGIDSSANPRDFPPGYLLSDIGDANGE